MRLIVIIFCCLVISCNSSKNNHSFSFFVAGHSYGNPMEKGKTKGLYKPFKDKIPYINNHQKMLFGVLLGDVVWSPKDWDKAKEDIGLFDIPIYIARGNHDGPIKPFEKHFGKSFRKFLEKDNLFIILDPNIDNWNISGEQLVFLKNTLRNKPKTIKNVFIFSHQLIWWSKDKFSKPKPNSLSKRDDKTNFWTEIEPLLVSQKIPVFIMAGDVGAFSKERKKRDHVIEYFYHSYNNITFIATGMGGGVRDNFVIADVQEDGSVNFELIHLNGDQINSLGRLEDYNLHHDFK